ncbi:MAG: hypothetical protein MI861_14545 [Pirellulales bacterium]|nr:hypothetical protein [Pirellulales bacterium]
MKDQFQLAAWHLRRQGVQWAGCDQRVNGKSSQQVLQQLAEGKDVTKADVQFLATIINVSVQAEIDEFRDYAKTNSVWKFDPNADEPNPNSNKADAPLQQEAQKPFVNNNNNVNNAQEESEAIN